MPLMKHQVASLVIQIQPVMPPSHSKEVNIASLLGLSAFSPTAKMKHITPRRYRMISMLLFTLEF